MKQYIKPIIEESTLSNETLMITGSIIDNEDSATQYSNTRRGNWGNLWEADKSE